MGKMQINPVTSKCLYGLIFAALASFINAQEVSIAFSGGGEFLLSTGGYRFSYQGGSLDSGALNLNKGDIIQTGAGSFVELRIEPGGTRIKIAENTSMVYNGAGQEARSTSFSLIYGRIRIATGTIWQHGEGSAVHVRTGQVETGFRIGDAGIDYIVNPQKSQLSRGEPILTVFNFQGNSELRPLSLNSAQTAVPSFVVYEYESLTLEMSNSLSYIERKPLDDEIIHYWNRHNFSDGAPLLTARPTGTDAILPPQAGSIQSEAAQTSQVVERIEYVYPPAKIEYVYPDNPANKKMSRLKNALITTGMVFTAGGIGMQIAGSVGIPSLDNKTNSMILNLGYIPLVIGLIFTGASLAINPQMVQNAAD
jgi:hypothetical protein